MLCLPYIGEDLLHRMLGRLRGNDGLQIMLVNLAIENDVEVLGQLGGRDDLDAVVVCAILVEEGTFDALLEFVEILLEFPFHLGLQIFKVILN